MARARKADPAQGGAAIATVEAPARVGPAWQSPEFLALVKLVPYARNARIHDAAQLEALKASMVKNGWTMPVLVDESGMILAGHGRVMAAEMLGYTEVPCLIAKGWTEDAKRAYILADNKLTERAQWDWRMVSAELKALDQSGFDLALTGFEAFELEPLLAADWSPPKAAEPDPEESEESPHGATDGRSIAVTVEQYERIRRAITLVRERAHDEDMSEGRALEVVAEAYQ